MVSRILIIEDEALIALDIEQAVEDAGATVAGMVHTAEDGLAALDTVEFDAVIVDANLGGDSAEPIVKRLDETRVRYLVVSGYSRDQLGFIGADAPLLGKPFAFAELGTAIRAHLVTTRTAAE